MNAHRTNHHFRRPLHCFARFALAALLAIVVLPPRAASARPGAGKSESIGILPGEFTLDSPDRAQRLSVVHQTSGETGAVVDPSIYTLHSSDPSVVRVEDLRAHPVGDGIASIDVRTKRGEVVSRCKVRVTGMRHSGVPNFRNEVQAVLSRRGCNMGACHGSLAGKGGFRLSLRGYDSRADFVSITRQARGRRIEMAAPGRSLLLAKPSGAIPHKGGVKFSPEDPDYWTVANWIRQGAPGPSADDAKLQRIAILPERARLAVGDRSQILVNAHYDDGRVVDVTHWAQFTATDEAVAGVDSDGEVTVIGSGESAVLVWFGSQVALARMSVPFPNRIDPAILDQAPRRNFIDELNLQQLASLRLAPAMRCDDEAFLRRVTLDTVGRLPTMNEREAFLHDDRPTKRDEVIERLLESERYVDYWTYRWSDMLLINGTRLRPVAVKAYYQWVRRRVEQNTPWDEFVRELITATGDSHENGATNFFALHQSPEDMTENACQAFLGLSIGCAKCHNHPLEKWTNDQYYAMANLFARVRAKGWGGETRKGDGIRTLYVADSGELLQPSTGRPQPPAPLDQPPLEFDDPVDRRLVLARWMTSPENPYFARAITNRVWANFFARGLVEPVDDLRLSNPASNESLLNAAAAFLVESDFDLKTLIRAILQSETYQRSSRSSGLNVGDTKYLSRYFPRRLMAEVLLDAIDQTLDTTTTFDSIAFPGADKQKTDFYPAGTRAIELYDASVSSYFLKTFGRNPREITCECERSAEPNMVQALHLSNGDTLNTKLAADGNRVDQWIDAKLNDTAIITRMFQSMLTRDPTPSELETIRAVATEYGDDRRLALQDVAWSILTSTEFSFNH